MTLIKSISGFRGTIGGQYGEALTPIDIVTLTAGYGQWLKSKSPHPSVVIGRDGRVTGPLVQTLVMNTLIMQGIDVIDAGLSTTPTVEMGVIQEKAQGGIILTASHNPMNWNALKLLNEKGEFLNQSEGQQVIQFADDFDQISFAPIEELGVFRRANHLLEDHIDHILNLPYVHVEAIKNADIKVVLDPVNSSGAIAVKALLDRLNVHCDIIHGEINGRFAHNPEPLEDHLQDLSKEVMSRNADMGIAVDPDVDRLAFVCEDGQMFGEENTLVAVSDYLLAKKPGPTVSNLSSTRGLKDVSNRYNQMNASSAVGEAHVVAKMKEIGAVIGGEGNGGVILPDLHYGRDALAGIAVFLSYYVEKGETMSALKQALPVYHMSKMKATLQPGMDPQRLLDLMQAKYAEHEGLNVTDGVKIDFEDSWIHMRKSNTEPIIRIYSEAKTKALAEDLANQFKNQLLSN